MLKQTTLSMLFFLTGLGMLPVHAWEDKEDNKPVGELERLTDWELCQEVEQVCSHSALPSSGVAMDALEYLTRIRQVAEKRYSEKLPAWLTDASSAIAAHEPQQCPAAACAQLREEGRESGTPAAGGESTVHPPVER